ncbi:MAG: hypothetical protein P8R54_07040 [Myxococcota bacterium]|nr:hypothetical protein [Myxococcota bacterium]
MAVPQPRQQPTSSPERQRLREIARRVRQDAQRQPEQYLKDSEVPHGGE